LRLRLVVALLVAAALHAPRAHAARGVDPPAAFVLIVGVNAPPSQELPRLRYADDDAARYFDLFRALGAKTYLLASLDENTRRLHPQAAAEARPARPTDLAQAVAAVAADVAQAHRRGLAAAFYVIYAGHGDVGKDGTAFLGLEGGRLTGGDLLDRVVAPGAADASHVIVDACYASLLITGRGAGGSARQVKGFLPRPGSAAARVGFLLSTSSGREAHEWEGVQAGVFSHEVRSGLYGAADADHDGSVSYVEIAAFVARANEGIANERFRPDVYARPPEGASDLLDLRKAPGGRLAVDGAHAGHWYLEDQEGVRLAEWHNGAHDDVELLRPIGRGKLYLVRADDGSELSIDPGEGSISVAELAAAPPRVAMRGAANDAFDRVFALPFDEGDVAAYELPPAPVWYEPEPRAWQHPTGWAAVGAAAFAGGVAGWLALETVDDRDAALGAASQQERDRHNRDLRDHRHGAYVMTGGAGAALAAGALLLLLPDTPPGRGVVIAPGGVLATWGWTY
jgi:hypothetical protein